LEVHAPNQASWQPTGFFSDGRRVMLLSLEPATFGPDRPYDRFYWQTRTHIWSYDLQKKDLVELATKNRVAAFYTPQAMLSDDRMLVQVAREAGVQTYSMNLDGSDAQEFTRLGEGVPYGFSVSPIESESPSIWLPTGTRSTPVTRTALIGR
jgi:TolB protein